MTDLQNLAPLRSLALAKDMAISALILATCYDWQQIDSLNTNYQNKCEYSPFCILRNSGGAFQIKVEELSQTILVCIKRRT